MNVALEFVYVRVAAFDRRRVVVALALNQAVLSIIPWKRPPPGTFSYPRECNSNLLWPTFLRCNGLNEVEPFIVAGIDRDTLWPPPYPPRMRVICCCGIEDLYRTF